MLISKSCRVRPEPLSGRFFRYNPASFGPLRLTTGLGVAVFAKPYSAKSMKGVDGCGGKFTEFAVRVPRSRQPRRMGGVMSVSILIVDRRFMSPTCFASNYSP
jgi:hypothetical protein